MLQAQVIASYGASRLGSTALPRLYAYTALGGFGGASYGGGSDRPSYGSAGGFASSRTDSFGMSMLAPAVLCAR